MPKQNISQEILAAALEGLQLQRERMENQISEVKRMLGTVSRQSASSTEAARPRRKLSAAARKRMSDAQKKRWTEFRKKKKA